MESMRRAVFILVVICVLAACLIAANLSRNAGEYGIDWRVVPLPGREVQVEYPRRGEIVQTLTAPGTFKAIEEANVASQIIGRVVAVKVKKGDAVKQGALLVKLDDIDARSRLDSLTARVSRLDAAIKVAEADREKALRDLALSKELIKKDAVTITELADHDTLAKKAEQSLKMWEQELAEAKAMRRAAEEELERTKILAPVDGVVTERSVEVGEIAIPGTLNLPGSVLMKIADLTKMQVEAEVDETDVLLVQPGQPARMYLQADEHEPIRGVVERVAAKGKKTGDVVSFETLIALSERPARIRAGMTATVEIEVARASGAVSLPVQAVVHRRRKDLPDTPVFQQFAERQARLPGEKKRQAESRYLKVVFVLDGGVVRARPVQTGLSDERRIEILAGLSADEQVVVGPFRVLDEIKDGQAVTVTEAGEEASP
jgi:HlyD family secretion protein